MCYSNNIIIKISNIDWNQKNLLLFLKQKSEK